MNIEEIKNLNIFGDLNISIEILKSQGFNNISYLIKTKNQNYVLRVFKSNQSVNISREFEFKTQEMANKLNIAPKPIFLNDNFMIYEYLNGIHKEKLSKNELKNLISTIKTLHSIKQKSKSYDFKKDFKGYKKNLKNKNSKDILKKLKSALKRSRKYKKELVLSHFYLNPKNILFSQNSVRIIDWEYAGTNDRFFDLASICIEFKLDKKMEKVALKSYFKTEALKRKKFKYYTKKLETFKIIYKSFCYLWFSSQNLA